MAFTCASESDDGYGHERDAVGCGRREGVAADVKERDEEKEEERENVAEGDADAEAELLDERVAENDTDERRADVRQTHVEYDRRRWVPTLHADVSNTHVAELTSWPRCYVPINKVRALSEAAIGHSVRPSVPCFLAKQVHLRAIRLPRDTNRKPHAGNQSRQSA